MLITLPTLLQTHTKGEKEVECGGDTIQQGLLQLVELYPSLKSYIFKQEEQLNPFINLYINGKDIRYLDQEKTLINPDDKVEILLSLAGG